MFLQTDVTELTVDLYVNYQKDQVYFKIPEIKNI